MAPLGDFADILAEIEDDRNVALTIENAAGADRIADALIDAVFQRNADIFGVSLQTADADAADDVARAFQRLAAIRRRRHARRQLVCFDDPVEDRLDHRQIVLTHIRQRKFNVAEFRHAEDVGEQLFVKPTLPAPIIAILKLMILTLKSVEQAAAGEMTAFSPRERIDCEMGRNRGFSPIAGPHRQSSAVFWRDYAYNHRSEQRTIMLSGVILCCRN